MQLLPEGARVVPHSCPGAPAEAIASALLGVLHGIEEGIQGDTALAQSGLLLSAHGHSIEDPGSIPAPDTCSLQPCSQSCGREGSIEIHAPPLHRMPAPSQVAEALTELMPKRGQGRVWSPHLQLPHEDILGDGRVAALNGLANVACLGSLALVAVAFLSCVLLPLRRKHIPKAGGIALVHIQGLGQGPELLPVHHPLWRGAECGEGFTWRVIARQHPRRKALQ
mmetsp:Transcript_77678/g.166517  ORF Transcript_77678/g.166517 Transcript_77678/m.166517 type:complete len:224 (+) Transcript_77678:665-1336(+)